MDIPTNKNQSAEKDTLRYGRIFGRYPDKKIKTARARYARAVLTAVSYIRDTV
jgi:hypothetical protein